VAVRTILQLGDPGIAGNRRAGLLIPLRPGFVCWSRTLADTLAHWRASTGYGRGDCRAADWCRESA